MRIGRDVLGLKLKKNVQSTTLSAHSTFVTRLKKTRGKMAKILAITMLFLLQVAGVFL